MAFDQPTRNRLSSFVGAARKLLSEEFTRQLQLEYGIDPATGEVAPLDRLAQLDDSRRETARLLRATLEHYLANNTNQGAKARQEALDRIVREQAFTVLNQLCALRMAEARGLLLQSVGRSHESQGFQLYARVAGTALGTDNVTVNGHPTERLPHNLNVSIRGIESRSLVVQLKNVAIATGSACTTAKVEPSHVILTLGCGESSGC